MYIYIYKYVCIYLIVTVFVSQYSQGHLDNERRPRFDFKEANKKGLVLASLDVKGSRGIRQVKF